MLVTLVMISVKVMCLTVLIDCLVCCQLYTRVMKRFPCDFSGKMKNGTRNKCLDFGGDLDHLGSMNVSTDSLTFKFQANSYIFMYDSFMMSMGAPKVFQIITGHHCEEYLTVMLEWDSDNAQNNPRMLKFMVPMVCIRPVIICHA